MGSYSSIRIKNEAFFWKKYGLIDFANLFFSQLDKVKRVVDIDEGEEIYEYAYITTVKKVKQILDVLGYTLKNVKKEYKTKKYDHIDYLYDGEDEEKRIKY